MLTSQVKAILTREFKQVPGLVSLSFRKGELHAQAALFVDPVTRADAAFEAFRDAVDRIMVEAPRAPYLTWCGVTRAPVPGAEVIRL